MTDSDSMWTTHAETHVTNDGLTPVLTGYVLAFSAAAGLVKGD